MSGIYPHTSRANERVGGSHLRRGQVAVILGDAMRRAGLSERPFNHLLFTGSTRVRRLVDAGRGQKT